MTDLTRPLAAGKEAEIFAWGEDVLKLTRRPGDAKPARREAAILRAVAGLGLAPAVREVVEIEGRWGVVMERIDAPVLGALLSEPARWDDVLALMLRLHLRIHAATTPGLLPLKARLAERIGRAGQLSEAVRGDLLARLAAMPEGNRLCHGDFHPFNILGGESEILPKIDEPRHDSGLNRTKARVVDWLDATLGDPAADVCRTFVLARNFSEPLARAYVSAYAAASGIAEAAIYAWLPFVAAARLLENVPEEIASLRAMAMGDSPQGGT